MASGSNKKFLARQKILSGETPFVNGVGAQFTEGTSTSSPWVKKAELPSFSKTKLNGSEPANTPEDNASAWGVSTLPETAPELDSPTLSQASGSDWDDAFAMVSPWGAMGEGALVKAREASISPSATVPSTLEVRFKSRNLNVPHSNGVKRRESTVVDNTKGWNSLTTEARDALDAKTGK